MAGVLKVTFASGTQTTLPISSIANVTFDGSNLTIMDINNVQYPVITSTATQADYDALVAQFENGKVKITTC